jgi:hypothetical protein
MNMGRKAVRTALFNLLQSGLTLAQAGYAFTKHDLDGQSPVFYLSSSGSKPATLTGRGVTKALFINVHLLTLYALDNTYTEQSAEDSLDDLEDQLVTTLATNQKTANWQFLKWSGRSNADDLLIIGGAAYLHEIIPLELEVF